MGNSDRFDTNDLAAFLKTEPSAEERLRAYDRYFNYRPMTWQYTHCQGNLLPNGIRRVDMMYEISTVMVKDKNGQWVGTVDQDKPANLLPCRVGVTYQCLHCNNPLTLAQILKIDPGWQVNLMQTIMGEHAHS